MARGATLAELLTVLVIVGVTAAIVTPPLSRALDSASVHAAADRYAALHETARQLAVARSRLARLELDTTGPAATISLRQAGAWDTVRTWNLGGARLSATQTTITFSQLGLGFGASNTRLVFSRGTSAETLTVSRTGRLKRW